MLVDWACTARAVQGQLVIPMTKARINGERPLKATDNKITTTMDGMASTMLVHPIRMLSTVPPWKPATRPINRPIPVAMTPATSPTSNEVRIPLTRLDNTLWPSLSVPSHMARLDMVGLS